MEELCSYLFYFYSIYAHIIFFLNNAIKIIQLLLFTTEAMANNELIII